MGQLWKPAGEHTGKLVVLFDHSPGEVVIRDADTGAVLEVGHSTGASNGYQDTIRFNNPGSAYNNVLVETSTGESFFIGSGGNRYENISMSAPGTVPTRTEGVQSPGGMSNILGIPGIGNVASPLLLDPNLIKEYPIEFNALEPADYTFTDPLETAKTVAAENRKQIGTTFVDSLKRGETLSEADIAQQVNYLNKISPVQRELMSLENQFNQEEKLGAAETAVPGITDTIRGRIGRAETLAQGKLLSTAEDRALEMTARSIAADEVATRGFGDDSIVGKTTGDILSAKERLNVISLGESFLNNALSQANSILIDTPQKATLASQIPATPRYSMSQLATTQQALETPLTTISPEAAQSSYTQQNQFETNLEQRTAEINQSKDLEVQTYNSNMAWTANMARLGIISSNVQAQNTFQQAALNDQLATQERDNLESRLNTALNAYKNNKNQAELLKSLVSIFGSKDSIPNSILRQIYEEVGKPVYDWLAGQLSDSEDSGEDITFSATAPETAAQDASASIGGTTSDTGSTTVETDAFIDEEGNVVIPDFDFNIETESSGYSLNSTYAFRLDSDSSEFEGMI